MTREILQANALTYSQLHSRLILSWATGVGKTLAALKIAKNFKGRWYIVVSEISHIKTWNDDIVKHGFEDLLMYIDIFCYDSLHKYINTQVEGIVLDEGHHAGTEIITSRLTTIKTNHIVVLTATLPATTKSYLAYTFGSFHEYHYSLSQAIKDQVLPEPKIFLVGIELPNKQTSHVITKGYKNQHTYLECQYGDHYRLLKSYNHLHLTVHCTEQEKYQMMEDEVDFAREQYFAAYDKPTISAKTKLFYKNRWLQLGMKRKRFMASIKNPVAKLILEKIKDYKFICFTGTVEQAKDLAFSDHMVINSYKKKTENSEIISNFDKGNIRALFATGMLTEGANLAGIEACLIIQLDNQTKSTVQKLGRALRAESPICYVLYLKGTQDEKYLKTAFTGFNSDYLYYTNIEEL